MAKVLLCGDLHMCRQSSIVTGMGEKFSRRLENCVKTINWVEELAESERCDAVIYLGDFFDKPDLDEYTITAAKTIKWRSVPKYIIVGNHDTMDKNIVCSSAAMLGAPEGDGEAARVIVNQPCVKQFGDRSVVFLPYISESDRLSLSEYTKGDRNAIVLSHNDIAGINYGPVMSRLGFDMDEIREGCAMFVNGHLHNGEWLIKNKLRNIGNITGQNFGEDATRYLHQVMILDTDTLGFEDFENPHAYNFYKISIDSESDIRKLDGIKPNAVLSVTCAEALVDQAKRKIAADERVAESRILTVRPTMTASEAATADLSSLRVDHIGRFAECARANIGNSAILEEELGIICQ